MQLCAAIQKGMWCVVVHSVLFVCFMAPSTVFGASEPEANVVATVNIGDAHIIAQDEKEIQVGFTLTNRVGAQGEVKYAISLMRESGGVKTLVDRVVYRESVSLGEGALLPVAVMYTVPPYLQGDFGVYVEAGNSQGLRFGMSKAGTTTRDARKTPVEIVYDTCAYHVAEDVSNTRYALEGGIDVAVDEHLMVSCTLNNAFPEDVVVTPLLTTYEANVFGNPLREKKGEPITIRGGGTTTITVSVTEGEPPQVYSATLALTDSEGQRVSPETLLSYTVQGKFARIQNVVFDKPSYAKGETASLSLFWLSPSNFGAPKRHGGEEYTVASAETRVTSGGVCAGAVCTMEFYPGCV